ncbi:MAG: putative rane protein [Ilumatobacteraceae bacterium]|nr:putative rane protein [Ilumatobacteraceae bacterium]
MIASVLLASAAAIAVLMIVTWLVSLLVRDASIVDIIWGAGFVVVAITAAAVGDGFDDRRYLLLALVGAWGVRLSSYLAWRNLGHGEDYRYVAMREKHGDRFWLVSLYQVFLLQGALMWVVSLPVQLSATADAPASFGLLAYLGIAVWTVGLLFESVGDAQLTAFKAKPENKGRVMAGGLWRYTRHPNYFGDFCVWWGVFLIAAETVPGRFGIIGPIVMSTLLIRVSGVAMLEKTIGKRRPGYADYIERTSAFFPRPPKHLPGDP